MGCKRHRQEMLQIKQRMYGICLDATSVIKDLYHGDDNYINLWNSKSMFMQLNDGPLSRNEQQHETWAVHQNHTPPPPPLPSPPHLLKIKPIAQSGQWKWIDFMFRVYVCIISAKVLFKNAQCMSKSVIHLKLTYLMRRPAVVCSRCYTCLLCECNPRFCWNYLVVEEDECIEILQRWFIYLIRPCARFF